MNAREMRDLERPELDKQIATLRKDLFGLRFANATGELDDTAGIRRAKRDLARALTVARERELSPSRASATSRPSGLRATDHRTG
jgi:large subunit ribosomal protein L29